MKSEPYRLSRSGDLRDVLSSTLPLYPRCRIPIGPAVLTLLSLFALPHTPGLFLTVLDARGQDSPANSRQMAQTGNVYGGLQRALWRVRDQFERSDERQRPLDHGLRRRPHSRLTLPRRFLLCRPVSRRKGGDTRSAVYRSFTTVRPARHHQ